MAGSPGVAAERVLDAMASEMLSETHRWPNGAVVIPSDLPHFGAAVADAVQRGAPFVFVFPDGQEIAFMPAAHANGAIDLQATVTALRRLGPLTSDRAPVDWQAYGASVAATNPLYEPPVAIA